MAFLGPVVQGATTSQFTGGPLRLWRPPKRCAQRAKQEGHTSATAARLAAEVLEVECETVSPRTGTVPTGTRAALKL
jgi:hypothetical protein